MIMIIRKISGVRVERRELQQNAALLLVPPPALTEVGPLLLKRGPCFEKHITVLMYGVVGGVWQLIVGKKLHCISFLSYTVSLLLYNAL